MFGVGMLSWSELFSGKVCGYVPGATADGESGSSTVVFLKQLSHVGHKIDLQKRFFENEPLHE
jgi:hypothetical protein